MRAAHTYDRVPSPVQTCIARLPGSQSTGNGSDLSFESYICQIIFFIEKATTNFQSEGGKNENDSIIVYDEIN